MTRPPSKDKTSDQHSRLFLGKHSGDGVFVSHCDILHDVYSHKNLSQTLFWILDFAVTQSLVIDFQTYFFLGLNPGGFAIFSLVREFQMIQMHICTELSVKDLL